MPERTNEEVVHAYTAAFEAVDRDALSALRHRDYVAEWPQSGERVRGDANMRAINDNWPGGQVEAHLEPGHIVGSEDRWVMTPSYTLQRVAGSGDAWWADLSVRYPDGSTWTMIAFLELRDGKVLREVDYFAQPFEPAPWRARWVERTG